MQPIDYIANMLEMLDHPAFCVSDGIISAANQAALARFLVPGMPVSPLLFSGQEEYAQFSGGTMQMTLMLGVERCPATVTELGGYHIFRLPQTEAQPERQALALAAQELRGPLNDTMALCQDLFSHCAPMPDPAAEQAAQINRDLYRMLRIVGNMSFTAAPRLEMQDVTAVLGELFESAAHYCESAGITLIFSNLPVPVYSLIDSDLLGRAVHNLLSNAMRSSGSGGTITAQLTRRGGTLYLSIQDSGTGTDTKSLSSIFDRFRREPGPSTTSGLGIGLSIVDAVARAHGGVAIVDQSPGTGMRAVISLPIRQSGGMRSPALHIDYAGERCRELIELSDVLPCSLYMPQSE